SPGRESFSVHLVQQRSFQQRAVLPGVSEGCRVSRSPGGSGLCSGSFYYSVLTLKVTVYVYALLYLIPHSFSVIFALCLQVAIKAPNSEDSSYVNKKGFHSVGCQIVCDARGLLLSAETHWPGGLKDTDVLERSALHKQLQDVEKGWLLGDRRYPVRKWLMTPVDNPESPAEFRYNLAHTATHEIVDRTFRAIQTRFRCLDGTKGYLQVFCSTLLYMDQHHEQCRPFIKTSVTMSLLLCAVFSREEFIHPAGLLRPPQRLPAVWIRRLDSGEDGPLGAAREPGTETRGQRQPGRGPQKTAHTQTLQLKRLLGSDSSQI
uniref:Harbinger transposase derived 1 n=1 Tax=Lates calcarifer TaxID=8187 RepID=A0A4W6EW19_LATCA